MAKKYKYRFFVSYAWNDNCPPIYDKFGWVNCFVKELDNALTGISGERQELFIDYDKLLTDEGIQEGLWEALKESALMVCVLSPSYLKSEWCTKELSRFEELLKKKRNQSGSIFCVALYGGLDRRFDLTLPKRLQKILRIPFFKQDGVGPVDWPLDFQNIEDRVDLRNSMSKLAGDMNKRLERLNRKARQ